MTDGALVLLVSPSLRQSCELFLKVLSNYRLLGRPVPTVGSKDSATKMELANGSRIISLPGTEETIRGYSSVALLVIDEAARVPDELYKSIRPMLAVSGGRLIAISSAYAKQGWFYESWIADDDPSAPWNRVKVTADQCSRISPAFLAEERRALGERWYMMEYHCIFGEAVDSVFREEDIAAAFANDLQPL